MRKSSINIRSIIKSNNRFEGNHYLNTHSFLSLFLEKNSEKCKRLVELATVFNPPVFKRQFCKKSPRAVKYFQSSDVQLASEDSNVFVFSGQTDKLNLLVKQNDILVTGFGTIGCTRLVSKYQDNTCYANNVCRIRVYPNFYRGFIYAFLASKYGNAQLNKNASGSVVRYIEAPGIKKILVPFLSDKFQKIIDDLILESTKLREDANDDLIRAKQLFESEIGQSRVNLGFNTKIVKSNSLTAKNKRFDSQYQIGKLELSKYHDSIKIGSIAKKIFVGNRGKRNYVENGIPFLSSSDMMLSNPLRSCKNISKRTPSLSEMLVNKGDILISRSGTVGNTIIVGRTLSGVAVSEHAMRLVIDSDEISPEYVFAYFMTQHGHDALQILPYGSVIVTLGEDFLADVDLPVLEKTKRDTITGLISSYIEKQDLSIEKENKAILMVEKEIEKWNN